MSAGGLGTKWQNIPENFNRLSIGARALKTDDRQTTDGRAIAYSERSLKTVGPILTIYVA